MARDNASLLGVPRCLPEREPVPLSDTYHWPQPQAKPLGPAPQKVALCTGVYVRTHTNVCARGMSQACWWQDLQHGSRRKVNNGGNEWRHNTLCLSPACPPWPIRRCRTGLHSHRAAFCTSGCKAQSQSHTTTVPQTHRPHNYTFRGVWDRSMGLQKET